MKIALLGYGKMGKIIEKSAIKRGHSITLVADSDNYNETLLRQADVAIEFTQPDAVLSNVNKCMVQNTPIVIGTTGWYDKINSATTLCNENNGALLYASNFSIGMNIFFALNSYLAKIMNVQLDYTASIEEIHHTEKKDTPSGSAVTLANEIILQTDRLSNWENTITDSKNILPIISKRIADVAGTHKIKYSSDIDEIIITHKANNREGFALGSLLAAEWLIGKKGVFTLKDMFNFDDL